MTDITLEKAQAIKTLFEAMAIVPSWLSKRYVLTKLLDMNDEDLKLNIKLMHEEKTSMKQGNLL